MSAAFIPPLTAVQEPAVASLTPMASAAGVGAMPGVQATPTATFGQMVANGLEQVNGQLQVAQADLQGLASGQVQNLHQVMIRLEESRMAFQLMLQVRNRLLESYQDLMRMQV